MRVKFTRQIANTPAGETRELSPGAAARMLAQGHAVRVEELPDDSGQTENPEHHNDPISARPAPSDHKAMWVEYARTLGIENASDHTKKQLIALVEG